ncbi:MFS transporter [Hamadaea tsunoensis]|uniref:MFS transporter n=1 Tax=Hamadaea tsunoensis TaxID=53368 RepID=UPI000420C92B|nr:MFS transporter [Hamadaea tsunoensis]
MTAPGATGVGLRVGALFGPAVFGVTAAAVALPDVAGALEVTPSAVVWVLTAHALALGVGTAVAGRVADGRGVRPVLLAGALLLTVGALVCVTATGLGVVIGGRLLLAAGSAAVTAGAVAVLAGGEPARRVRTLAAYGMVVAAFAATATLVGALTTTWWSWRVTLILPVLSVAAVPFCLPLARRPGSRHPFDAPGAALLTIAASALVVLIQAHSLNLRTPQVLALAAVLIGASAALAWWTARRRDGVLPRVIVANGRFLTDTAVGVGVFGALFATLYAVPQLLARRHGWDTMSIGAALLPGAAVGAVLSRAAGRFGPSAQRRLLAASTAATALALAAAAATGAAWLAVTAASCALATFAVTQVVLTGQMSAHLPPSMRGSGLGLFNLACFVGGAAASALTAALIAPMGLARPLFVVALLPLGATALALLSPRRQALLPPPVPRAGDPEPAGGEPPAHTAVV